MKVTSENYVELAIKTAAPIEPAIERLKDPKVVTLLHAAMGLSTEANEFLDMLKKHIFYGKSLDLVNAGEEILDSEWYIALAISVLDTTLEELMTKNIDKLAARYPEKFSPDKAINRDLDKERKILEGKTTHMLEEYKDIFSESSEITTTFLLIFV